MERKEAIRILKGDTLFNSREKREALDMAISSLETDEAYQLEYEHIAEIKDNALDFQAVMLNDLWKANNQLKKQIEILKLDRDCEVDSIPRERIGQMIAEIKQIHSDWFKEYDSATAYTKISEFIHKYTKEQTDD